MPDLDVRPTKADLAIQLSWTSQKAQIFLANGVVYSSEHVLAQTGHGRPMIHLMAYFH